MIVYLKLYGGLQKQPGGGEPEHYDVPREATIGELLTYAKVAGDSVKIVLLNGVHADLGQTLKDGDEVSVFPPVAGG